MRIARSQIRSRCVRCAVFSGSDGDFRENSRIAQSDFGSHPDLSRLHLCYFPTHPDLPRQKVNLTGVLNSNMFQTVASKISFCPSNAFAFECGGFSANGFFNIC